MTRSRRSIHIYRGCRDTDVPLEKYMESRFNSIEEALRLARNSMKEKLDGFPTEYMRKSEYEKAHENIVSEVNGVRKDIAAVVLDIQNNIKPSMERKTAEAITAIVVTALISGVVVALAASFISHIWPK